MKVIGGDFGENTSAIVTTSFFGKFKAIVFSGCLWHRKLRRRDIISIEVVDDTNKVNLGGAIGGGMVGALLLGPIGLLAGSLLAGRGKGHIVLIQDRRQRRLLGMVNQREFKLLLSVMAITHRR